MSESYWLGPKAEWSRAPGLFSLSFPTVYNVTIYLMLLHTQHLFMYCHVLRNAYYWYSLPLLCVYMWSWELNSGLLCMLWKNSTIQLLLLVLRSVFNKVTCFLTIEFLTDQICISQTYYTINYLDCFILYRNFFAFAVCDLGILF